jgi:hypothetical protein
MDPSLHADLGGTALPRFDRPSRDLVVKSSGFKPGGTLDYTITMRGIAPAPHASVTASMSSDGVPGTTIVQTRLPVVSP